MIKHNLSRSRINKIYLAMKNRCYCKTSDRYSYYGGRGIKICDEWLSDFMSFYNWAMANGYNDKLTIDRINVNGNYEPSNCRWITKGEQSRNTRRNKIYKGKCFSEWARELGISPQSFWERVEKFGIEKAIKFKDNFHKLRNSMLDIEQIKKDYYKMTNKECAKKHNISKEFLTYILNKFKITKKSSFYNRQIIKSLIGEE